MAWAAVQRKGKGGLGVTSLAIGSGDGWSTPTSGNLLVVTANSDATVSTPTGYTAGPSVVDGNGAYVFWKISDGTESTVTVTPGSAANTSMTAAEYSGNTASPLDVSNSSTISGSAGTTTTSVSVTTTADGDLVIAAALIHSGVGGTAATGPSWTNSFVNQVSGSTGNASPTCDSFVGELVVGAAGAYSTSASWTNSANDRQELVIAFKAAAATAVSYNSPRYGQPRDYSVAPWAQRDRRDANTAATAANPLASPLDSAWQAGGRYWHLYGDRIPGAGWPQQRGPVGDPSLLGPAPTDPLTLAAGVGGDPWRRYNAAAFCDRREVPQQRAYLSDPSLLLSAELENELLGGADTGRRYLAAAYVDRREVPQQRAYVSDPLLLTTALLENELLGGAGTSSRAVVPATHAARWWMPRQPKRDATTPGLLDTAELENELLGGADTARHYLAAAFYDRREVPQQRQYVSDPLLLVPPVPLDPTLAGWLPTWQAYAQAAVHVDRREVPQQRLYISDPSFYPTTAPTDPLTLAWGAGGTYWLLYATAALQVSRREVPQQRAYVSDPSLLATALLEDVLLGGADTWRHAQVFTDRRQPVPARPVFDPNGLAAPATDPLLLAAGVGGDLWRRANTPAYADRREAPAQPPRWALYFDAGPDQPPLTLAYGAGGSWWHRIHWRRPSRSWWQPRPVFAQLGNPCVTVRPFTATTGRPSAGVTSRPDTGITEDPC